MALINCPECNKEISDTVKACPHCGYSFEKSVPQLPENTTGNEDNSSLSKNRNSKKVIIPIVIIIVLVFVAVGVYFLATANSRNYEKAVELYKAENYSESLEIFNKISDYNDSADYIKKCEYELSVNGQFLRALATGLEDRWKLNDKVDKDKNSEATTKDWENYINAEYNQVGKFAKMDFEDEKLGNLAKDYIKLLESAKGIVKYYGSNKNAFWNEYNPIYQDRCIIIMKISNDYVIPVNDKRKTTLNDLITEGELSNEIKAILKEAKFKKVSDSFGWKGYEAVVKNTSSTEFSWFCFNINLVDKNGTIVDTEMASTDNWSVGSKHKFKFSTSEKFDKIVVNSCNYS
ncbi:MAG: zinc ribbon domain-containing protein [Eubacterium sp.]|nr:zinc ribbon domain-containing protein [Eubacterium sp.]